MLLIFKSDNPTEVQGFMDSDYAGNRDNRKSTSGYVCIYGGGAISWRLKLQDFTTLSTTEDDDIAASKVAKEPIWLHRLSTDFSAKGRTDHSAPTLYCDSQSALHLIRNLVYHAKTKHIEGRYHHIRELVTNK